MINLKIGAVVCAALTLVITQGTAQAQYGPSGMSPNLEGFSVAGKGATGAKPNRLEIDLEISAASEMTSDVIVKYRDAKKRLQEAFTTLKLKDVAVEEKALVVDQKGQTFNPYMMDSPPARRGKVEVQLTRKLVVTSTNIRDLDEEALLQLVAKLLDVAQDAGAKVGPSNDYNPYYYYRSNTSNGLVRFILDDFDALQEKAYQSAIADARARAGRLAKISGLELGPVAGVREVVIPGEGSQNNNNNYYYGGMNESTEEEPPRKRIVSTKFQEIPIKVELMVRFNTTPLKAPGREAGQ